MAVRVSRFYRDTIADAVAQFQRNRAGIPGWPRNLLLFRMSSVTQLLLVQEMHHAEATDTTSV